MDHQMDHRLAHWKDCWLVHSRWITRRTLHSRARWFTGVVCVPEQFGPPIGPPGRLWSGCGQMDHQRDHRMDHRMDHQDLRIWTTDVCSGWPLARPFTSETVIHEHKITKGNTSFPPDSKQETARIYTRSADRRTVQKYRNLFQNLFCC